MDVESYWVMLLGFMLVSDFIISSYTRAGGFHADRDPELATNCVAGFRELIRTALFDLEPQQLVLCWTFFLLAFAVLSGYLLMTYLGLYGVFVSQFSALAIFWISLLLNFQNFVINGLTCHMVVGKWFTLTNSCVVNFELYIDLISFSFALLTTSIAVFVNLYAFSYFRFEPNIDRLLLFINSFVVSMVLLVFAGNLALLFMGWELIGLTSFLLINFWGTRIGTLKSAFKAYAFNKVSDFFMLVGLLLCAISFKDLSIPALLMEFNPANPFYLTNIVRLHNLDLIVAAFLGAAFIKSAQVGGHVWLPDSMEAPVPASALIHSATLVSAGIFLILRLYPLFEHTRLFYMLTPLIGAFTAMYGGVVAYHQADLKRILAYSTISHCGFLIFMTTLGATDYTLAYLYVHGLFKALAFLCAGNIIRFTKNYQDVQRMGQLWKYLPFECAAMTLALANLSGAPFFFGFCIKHLALCSADKFAFLWLVQPMLLIASCTGLMYSYKILYYVFFDTKRGRLSLYAPLSRKDLDSKHYSNANPAALCSIVALAFAAYAVLLVLLYHLVWSKSLTVDLNSLFLKNQGFNSLHLDQHNLYNFSFLNWTVIMLVSSVGLLKWGQAHSASYAGERSGAYTVSSLVVCLILQLLFAH